jgi:hypothetical protein
MRVDVRFKRALEAGTLPRDLVVIGPAGTGKTYAILRTLHCLLADYPNLRFLLCRQTRRSLTESVLVTYEQEILAGDGMGWLAWGVHRRNRQSYDYPNGSTLVLGGLDNADRILSTAWDVVYINEAIEIMEDSWEMLSTRLNRPGRPRWLGHLIGDTNPGDPSHWLKARIDDGRTEQWETDHRANPALHDGEDWTLAGYRYRDALDSLRGTRRKRLKEGLWAAGSGQWFENFGADHVSAEARYDDRLPVHLAVDSGVHTGAVWFQVRELDNGGHLITVFADYYAFNLPAYKNAVAIKERGEALCGGRIDRGTTDPAWSASTATGPTVLEEYRRAKLGNLNAWPSYGGSVIDGLSLIESFVATDPPGLLIHRRCTRLIEAFGNYKREQKAGQYIDRPVDPQHPHEELLDALRGGLQDKFPAGRKPPSRIPRAPGRKVF